MKKLITLIFLITGSLSIQAQITPVPDWKPEGQVPASRAKLYVDVEATVYIRCPGRPWSGYRLEPGVYYMTINNCGVGKSDAKKELKTCLSCSAIPLEGGCRYGISQYEGQIQPRKVSSD